MYIDGFNLYYRRLKNTGLKWLDVRELAGLLLPGIEIHGVRYFTARISDRPGEPGQRFRQQVYLRAIATLPDVTIHYGLFSKPRRKRRPLADDPSSFVEILETVEKGSDVNLGAHLLLDAFADEFDVALVVSNDSDLSTPVQMVRGVLGKRVGVAIPGTQHSIPRSSIRADFYTRVSKAKLERSQLPEELSDEHGTIRKPSAW